MSAATQQLTSAFIPDVLAAMGAGRMVIIDGAIDDDVLLDDAPVSPAQAISDSWAEAGPVLVVQWTLDDGLQTAEPDDRSRLRELLRESTGQPGVQDAVSPDPLDRRQPLDLAQMIGWLLAQERERVLIVVDHADLAWMATPDPVGRRVTASLLQAVETFEATSELHALVLLTRDVGLLSPHFARRAGVAQVRIAANTVEQRALIAARAFDRPVDDPDITRLAIGTDGFALREVAMLEAHAQVSRIGLDQPRELAASFRHGYPNDPWAALSHDRMDEIRADIREHVFGQEDAVEDILDRLEVARSGLELDPPSGGARKSRLELFLVGPTGVGKNELARALARSLFGDSSAVLIFDMSAFQQEHSGERLFGAPPGYVGHESGSPLVNRLRERPFTVVVFDEIEKAHANNWLRLMAAIDEGRITDARHVEASLENAIVIFTSNIGGTELRERAQAGPVTTKEVKRLSRKMVERHLATPSYVSGGESIAGLGKPEVWGRLQGSVVAFDVLREDAVARIVARFCDTLAESALRAHGIELDIDDASVARAVSGHLGQPGTWDGRKIKRHVHDLLRRPLARKLAASQLDGAGPFHAAVDGDDVLRVHSRRSLPRGGGRS